jgi:hypothetical protein
MSLKRKASATLQESDVQHPTKKAALLGKAQDGTASLASNTVYDMYGAVIPKALCSVAGLDMQQKQQEQQQQQQQQQQDNAPGDMEAQVRTPV